MDYWMDMLTRQRDLQRDSFNVDFYRMTDEQRMEYIRMNVLALTDELHEALGETGWKPWASANHINKQGYIAELVDALHFLMNLLLVTGVPPHVIAEHSYNIYVQKSTNNAERQAEGYDGVSTKCPHCARALDDVGVQALVILDEPCYACGHCNKSISNEQVLKSPILTRSVRASKIMNQT